MTPLADLHAWVIFASTAAHIIETWLVHDRPHAANDAA
jgi:hypothetical protein